MTVKTLSERRQALEDQFFQEMEAKKLSRLRDELAAKKESSELRETFGIEEQSLLDALISLGVHAGDVAAIALTPLVRVAWADGSIDDKEREAVLRAAHEQGIARDSHSYQLLVAWLQEEPDYALYSAWESYVKALRKHLKPEQADGLRENIMGLAHDVASAAGGFLGVGAISATEESALDAINDAFVDE